MTKITDLIDRWNTNEGKPYKGSMSSEPALPPIRN